MTQTTISFRAEEKKIASVDAIATALDRDRSYILNQAISAYLELYDWHSTHIKAGLKQANAGEFATEAEVAKALRKRAR